MSLGASEASWRTPELEAVTPPQEHDTYQYIVTDAKGNIHEVSVVPQPSSLAIETQDILVAQLTPVTGRGFLRKDVTAAALEEDVRNHVLGCERLVVCECDGAVSSFVAASVREHNGEKIYHLEGIIVEPDYQSTGIGFSLLRRELAVVQADTLAFHTQSIKMVRLGNKLAQLSRADAIRLGDVIHTSNQVGAKDIGRYGGQSLYEDGVFAEVAVKSLNWQNGDALICAGRVRAWE